MVGEAAESEAQAINGKLALERIETISRDARATWFLLLTYAVFVGVTLLGVRDLDFFSIESRTSLPVLNIAIPTATFFWAAPWLGAVLHVYFHIYLLKLWDAIADAPTAIDGVKLGDRIFVWLVNDWALRQRSDRPTTQRPMDRLGDLVSAIVVWLMIPLVITWTWWRSMTAHDAWLTLAIGGALLVSLYASLKGWRRAHERLREPNVNPRSPSAIEPLPTRWRKIVAAFGIAVAVVSLLRTQVGYIRVGPFEAKGLWLAPIDLTGAEVVVKPDDWVSRDTAERRFKITWCRDRQIPADACERPTEPYHTAARETWCGERSIEDCATEFERLQTAFDEEWQEQRGEYLANLTRPDLRGRDLRRADLRGAFVASVDLRGARLEGAILSWAQLEGADLRGAQLEGAILVGTWLESANLRNARLEGTVLGGARLRRANLVQARLQGANLVEARLNDADLRGARLEGANLVGARLDRANLGGAQLQGANLVDATLEGANLGEATLDKADLLGAEFDWIDFIISRVELPPASLRSVPTHFTNLKDVRGLTQDQLAEVIGDNHTILPRDAKTGKKLHVWTCWSEPPSTLANLLGHWPESEHELLRAEWLCGERKREPTGRAADPAPATPLAD